MAEYVAWVHSARLLDPTVPVRVPFERSAKDRAKRLQEGFLELPEVIHANLKALAS